MLIKPERLRFLLEEMRHKRIAVIGDIILDRYIYSNVSRISPEAPVPVAKAEKDINVPGGAANVASNINALNATSRLVGIIGRNTEPIIASFRQKHIDATDLITDPDRKTTEKIRVLSQQQQLLRIDYEDNHPLPAAILQAAQKSIKQVIAKDCDGVIVSDYAKGMITGPIMETIRSSCQEKNIPLGIDPKPHNWAIYKYATYITPNHVEAELMYHDSKHLPDSFEIGRSLMTELNAAIVLTEGKQGMTVFEPGNKPRRIPAKPVDVFDVTGAGDTVIAIVMLAMTAGATLFEASVIANYAASVVINKLGAATATREEILQRIKIIEGDLQ